MTNCDPSKLRSQNGQSSFLQGTKQPIKLDKKSRIRRPNFSSGGRFLASPESDFPDWFFIFSWLICHRAFSPASRRVYSVSRSGFGVELDTLVIVTGCTIPPVTFWPTLATLCHLRSAHAKCRKNESVLALLQIGGNINSPHLIIFPPLEIAQTYL